MRYVLDDNTAVIRICSTFLLIPARGPEGFCPPIYTINETAYMVLEQMKDPCSLNELTEAVAEDCDEDRKQIFSDMKKMISALLIKGFIRRVSLENPERND